MAGCPLLVCWKVNFNINDDLLTNFKSGDVQGSTATNFTQATGTSLIVQDGTVDEPISTEGFQFVQAMFFYADQAMGIKLVPQGSTRLETGDFILYPGMPTLLCVQNVKEIYVSNNSGQVGKLIFQAAGIF